jgi:hypothetical protein
MRRRHFLLLVLPAAIAAADGPPASMIRGKLGVNSDGKPVLHTKEGKDVLLEGDDETTGVLKDKRLAGADFEVAGSLTSAGVFKVNPIHTRAMHVYKDGKRLMVTYWCDVCSIRTYTPGLCWCCREETALDLRDPATVN